MLGVRMGEADESNEVSSRGDRPPIAVFAPNPLLTVTIEREGAGRESVHFHPGGQGVWAAQTARTMGAAPALCGFWGGEPGELLFPLLERALSSACLHLVPTTSPSGCYVLDRRGGERETLAMRLSDPPTRHELDELFSLTCSQAIACGSLLVTNPFPGDLLPLEFYSDLVADARAGGCRTFVDLSSPRLDSALASEPDLVKINDWELAEYMRGPVSTAELMLAGAQRLRESGARRVIVTRGPLPALVLDGEDAVALTPPRFEHGFREGCGDSMLGALAASWVLDQSFERAVVTGAAAGAANFLRHGLGHASREVVEELTDAVTLAPWSPATFA
jgi:1-phosphofructokinase